MLNRLLNNFKKDWKIALRDYFLLITIITVVIFYLVLEFIIPNSLENLSVNFYIDDEYIDLFKPEMENVIKIADTPEDLGNWMKENPDGYGIIITKNEPYPNVEIILQGSESPRMINLFELVIEKGMTEFLRGKFTYKNNYEIVTLNPELKNARISLKSLFLPLFIVLESAFIGFFLIAAMLFMEKEQRMHTAYLVSPGKAAEHLLSKQLVMLVLGLISSFTITFLMRGFEANYLYLFIIMSVASFFGSSLGLLVGSFFNSLTKSIMWLIVIIMGLMLPSISYMLPAFSPVWIKMIPTYQMIYAVKEAVIPIGENVLFFKFTLIVLIEGLLLYLAAQHIFLKSLLSKN